MGINNTLSIYKFFSFKRINAKNLKKKENSQSSIFLI